MDDNVGGDVVAAGRMLEDSDAEDAPAAPAEVRPPPSTTPGGGKRAGGPSRVKTGVPVDERGLYDNIHAKCPEEGRAEAHVRAGRAHRPTAAEHPFPDTLPPSPSAGRHRGVSGPREGR